MSKDLKTICANDNKYLVFLDELRESGVTNMLGAVPYLLNEFKELDEDSARDVLLNWIETFSERHS